MYHIHRCLWGIQEVYPCAAKFVLQLAALPSPIAWGSTDMLVLGTSRACPRAQLAECNIAHCNANLAQGIGISKLCYICQVRAWDPQTQCRLQHTLGHAPTFLEIGKISKMQPGTSGAPTKSSLRLLSCLGLSRAPGLAAGTES